VAVVPADHAAHAAARPVNGADLPDAAGAAGLRRHLHHDRRRPGDSTQTLSFLSYQTFIVATDFGAGGAMSLLLVVLALVVSAIYVRALRP